MFGGSGAGETGGVHTVGIGDFDGLFVFFDLEGGKIGVETCIVRTVYDGRLFR